MVRTPKSIAKAGVTHIAAMAAPFAWKCRKRRSLVVLMYHRVLPNDAPAVAAEQPGMYVSPGTLSLHIQVLKEYFELMHLDEWLRRAKQGNALPPLACAITFDDGWRDNYELALPVLMRHQAPATIFLVSNFIGTNYRFWPNRLIDMLRRAFAEPGSIDFPQPLRLVTDPVLAKAAVRGSLRPDDIDVAVRHAKTWDEGKIRDLVETAATNVNGNEGARDILSRGEITGMAATGLIRFGSHTATHFRLSGEVSSEVLEREILGSREDLQALCAQDIDLFCYPNGDTAPAAINLVRQHYLGAVCTRKGWHTVGGDPHLVRRIGVHEDISNSRESFLACLSGWF